MNEQLGLKGHSKRTEWLMLLYGLLGLLHHTDYVRRSVTAVGLHEHGHSFTFSRLVYPLVI
jgi:hypothetical protein